MSGLLVALTGQASLAQPAASKPVVRPLAALDEGRGAYATGQYRDLFAEAGYRQADIDARITRAWAQLFHGDPDTQRLYTPAGRNANGPLAYIPDIQHTDVRSEGMSYGMMIAVQLDKKEEFDALWNWSMTYMYQSNPAHPTYGFFSWQLNYDGTVISELPAPDGEEYYVMALYFAANRWGNGTGIYDYKAHADRLLRHMVHREPIKGPVRERAAVREHVVGKEVNDEHGMILFSPDERNTFTDVSYHLPAFYELWARWGPEEDRPFWARAAQVSRDMFVKAADPKTGLVPNLSNFDGTPYGTSRFPASFREDAWRVAMNWAVDWSWWTKDPRQRELSDRLQAFFESQGMGTYGDNWALDGTRLRDRHSPGLVATNGAASLSAANPVRARAFLDALWNLDVPSSKVFRYYDGLLYLMSLMHASGRFQVIQPREVMAARARVAEQSERIAASFVLALGRTPTEAEITDWSPTTQTSVADLLARHRQQLARDARARQTVAAKARQDSFGVAPAGYADKPPAAGELYVDAVRRHLGWITTNPAAYDALVHRAYQRVVPRDAYPEELTYWKALPPLPYALLAACVDDWGRRSQPGLTVTSGIASVSVNSTYLSTVRLSPRVAAEVRAAVGGRRPEPGATPRVVIGPGAEAVASIGGIHFVEAGSAEPQLPAGK